MRRAGWVFCMLFLHLRVSNGHFDDARAPGTDMCHGDDTFLCLDGSCIQYDLNCDGKADCKDGSDEEFCSREAEECNTTHQFQCNDSRYCIPLEWKCNGESECQDGSDEQNCTTEQVLQPKNSSCNGFQCHNGTCISILWVCDRHPDCLEKEDEGSFTNCRTRKVLESPPVDFPLCSADNGYFECKDRSFCLGEHRLCDNMTDCRDASDEGPFCKSWSNMCTNTTCEKGCVRTPTGPHCKCPHGYTHISNEECRDVNECTEHANSCGQHCQNTQGGYTCSCDPDYELAEDTYNCRVKSGEALLFYSLRNEVRYMNLKTNKTTVVTSGTNQAVGVTSDGVHVYWTEVVKGHEVIMRAELDNVASTKEVIVSMGVDTPEDVSVDWLTGNLYFTDSKFAHIGVCTPDGHHCTVVVAKGMHRPRAIALHPQYGQMYWTDWGKVPAIMRANMDGTEAITFIGTDVVWPNGLFLDLPNERLYWVDGHIGGIESVRLDGTLRHRVLQDVVHHPYWLAVFESTLYWSDWATDTLQSCEKFTAEHRTVLEKGHGHVYGIHVYHPAMMRHQSHPCEHGMCSDICLLKGNSSYTCACPQDKLLSQDGHTCRDSQRPQYLMVSGGTLLLRLRYRQLGKPEQTPVNLHIGRIDAQAYNPNKEVLYLYDGQRSSISYVKMDQFRDGIAGVLITEGIGRIADMDYDYVSDVLYWVDSEHSTLEVLSTRNNYRTVLHRFTGGEVPISICLVPQYGILLVALREPNEEIHIDSITLDGTSRKHVFEKGFRGPYIKIRYLPGLDTMYISDSGNYVIEVAHPEGTGRETFRDLFTTVYSLAVTETELFWTDRKTKKLFWTNVHEAEAPVRRMDLDVFNNHTQLHLTSITSPPSQHQAIMKHPCTREKTPCSHICVQSEHHSHTTAQSTSFLLEFKCLCPAGMFLGKDNSCEDRVNCSAGSVYCHRSNECLDKSRKCDGKADCAHGEDEEGCPDPSSHQCGSTEFHCLSGECVPRAQLCDLHNDCSDSSDEQNCNGTEAKTHCQDNQFPCNNSQCVDIVVVCDGFPDCPDKSDETPELCSSKTCDDTQFQCMSGSCIPKDWECDGEWDCSDNSDEHSSCLKGECEHGMFRCATGKCIDVSLRCDEQDDCGDFSDEEGCVDDNDTLAPECEDKEYSCPSNRSICLPFSARCNGTAECPRGADEFGCEQQFCTTEEFQCSTGRCIPRHQVCDGVRDCRDESDEAMDACKLVNSTMIHHMEVSMACDEGYVCDTGECIDFQYTCDGKANCRDGSDEHRACEIACDHNKCEHKCLPTPRGAVCSCPPGYRLSSNHKTCEDVNECALEGQCSHDCHNTVGSFHCTCHHGYSLRSDHRSCKAVKGHLYIYYVAGNTIRSLSWKGDLVKVFEDKAIRAINSLAVNVRKNMLYFTSEPMGTLYELNLSSGTRVVVTGVGSPTKVTVDWITGNVYFVDNTRGDKRIRMCHFERRKCAVLQKLPEDAEITALTVDPANYLMFYCVTRRSDSEVRSASLYGRRSDILLSVQRCTGLAANSYTKQLYVAENDPAHILVVNYEGDKRQKILTNDPRVIQPEGLALFEDHVYFLTPGSFKMTRCVLYGEKSCKAFNLNFFNSKSFALFEESAQRDDVIDKCKYVTCDSLCAPAPLGAHCVCEDGDLQKGTSCSIATAEKPALFNGWNSRNRLHSWNATSLVVMFVLTLLLLVVLVGYGFHRWHKSQLRNVNRPPVHFHNPAYGNEMRLGAGEPTVIITPSGDSTYTEFVNPLDRVRGAWRSLHSKYAAHRRPQGLSSLKPHTLDSDSDVESDRDGMDPTEKARLL